MKCRAGKYRQAAKGMPTAFVLGMRMPAVLFLLSGSMAVFAVDQVKEPESEAPTAVERPRMKLTQPRAGPQETPRPKTPDRIAPAKDPVGPPKIDMPALGDAGNDVGGYDIGLDVDFDMEPTLLGYNQSMGSDLVGTYYDTKYTRSGIFAPISVDEFRQVWYEFFRDDWNPRHFSEFYQAPKKLYAPYLLLPPVPSAHVPVAFGMPDDMASGGLWIVHYKGKLVHKDGITFRFWAGADDSIAIRVDGEVVVAASFTFSRFDRMFGGLWKPSDSSHMRFKYGIAPAGVGDWITLEPGIPRDIEVIAGDNNGANASFTVMVEEKGVAYPRKWDGQGPILPIFRMDELNHDQLDLIYGNFPDDEVNFTSGPIFREY